jgi:hypothetical protein
MLVERTEVALYAAVLSVVDVVWTTAPPYDQASVTCRRLVGTLRWDYARNYISDYKPYPFTESGFFPQNG